MAGENEGLQDGGNLAKVENQGLQTSLDNAQSENVQSEGDATLLNGNSSLLGASDSSTFRISKAHQRRGKEKSAAAEVEIIEETDRSLSSKWFLSLKSAFYSLRNAFRQPIILR